MCRQLGRKQCQGPHATIFNPEGSCHDIVTMAIMLSSRICITRNAMAAALFWLPHSVSPLDRWARVDARCAWAHRCTAQQALAQRKQQRRKQHFKWHIQLTTEAPAPRGWSGSWRTWCAQSSSAASALARSKPLVS